MGEDDVNLLKVMANNPKEAIYMLVDVLVVVKERIKALEDEVQTLRERSARDSGTERRAGVNTGGLSIG